MKKKIAYAAITAAIAITAFCGGRITRPGAIIPEDIKGWEYWESPEEVGIELQTVNGDYIITKKPFTLDTKVTKPLESLRN